jgi:hypothetical protein
VGRDVIRKAKARGTTIQINSIKKDSNLKFLYVLLDLIFRLSRVIFRGNSLSLLVVACSSARPGQKLYKYLFETLVTEPRHSTRLRPGRSGL